MCYLGWQEARMYDVPTEAVRAADACARACYHTHPEDGDYNTQTETTTIHIVSPVTGQQKILTTNNTHNVYMYISLSISLTGPVTSTARKRRFLRAGRKLARAAAHSPRVLDRHCRRLASSPACRSMAACSSSAWKKQIKNK